MSSKTINRRRFTQGLAAALAMPAFVPSKVLGEDAPSHKLNMGFIGTGNNGYGEMHSFMRDERVRVLAVCDVNDEGPGYWDGTIRGREPARRAVNQFYGDESCLAFVDFRDLLAREDIDIVYIGTPDHWHALNAIMAAEAKKDIFCQKPLSLTIAEGRAMVDAVKKHNVVWQTGSQQRSDVNFRRVCELVRNGRLGDIHTVRCGLPGGTPDFGRTAHLTDPAPIPEGFEYDFWLGPAPEAPYAPGRVGVNFRWILDYSGGQITDWGGHHPDIAQWGLDMDGSGPVKVKNAKGKFAEGPLYNTATEYYIEYEYENGVTLIISSSERGGVTFEGSEGKAWANRGRHEVEPESLQDEVIGPNEIHLYKSDNHNRNFIDCVLSREATVAPVEAAHRSITLSHLGNIAMLTGRDLSWDPVKEEFVGDEGANAMLRRPYRPPWNTIA